MSVEVFFLLISSLPGQCTCDSELPDCNLGCLEYMFLIPFPGPHEIIELKGNGGTQLQRLMKTIAGKNSLYHSKYKFPKVVITLRSNRPGQ